MSADLLAPAECSSPAVQTLELARTPGHLIRRAQQVHALLWVEHVGADLTGPQFAVLSTVAQQPGLDQTSASVLASLDKNTTAGIVRRLLRDGWLVRSEDAGDRRRKLLYLSRPARAALHAVTLRAAAVQQALLAPLTDTAQEDVMRGLATLGYDGHPPHSDDDAVGGLVPARLGLQLSAAPGHLIRRAQQAYTVKWNNHFGGALTGPQYAAMCALADTEPSDQATVGAAASLDKSSTAEIVERLRLRGLIDTENGVVGDRRRKLMRLSREARSQLPGLTARASVVQDELMVLLPEGLRPPFLSALAVVAYSKPNVAI